MNDEEDTFSGKVTVNGLGSTAIIYVDNKALKARSMILRVWIFNVKKISDDYYFYNCLGRGFEGTHCTQTLDFCWFISEGEGFLV